MPTGALSGVMRVVGKEVVLAVMSPTLSWAPWILLSQLPSHSSAVHLVHNSPFYLVLLSRCTKTSDRKKGCTVVDGKIRKCGWSSLTLLGQLPWNLQIQEEWEWWSLKYGISSSGGSNDYDGHACQGFYCSSQDPAKWHIFFTHQPFWKWCIWPVVMWLNTIAACIY